MKPQSTLPLITIALLLLTAGCAHWSDPCDDKLLKRTPSPSGKTILATYHRECPSKVYTTAMLEEPAGFLQSHGEVRCYIIAWGGRHPVEVVWKDADNILISTPDRLEKADFYDSKESCSGIKISYNVQFRNEQQTTDNPEVIAKIRKALSDLEPCILNYYHSSNSYENTVGYVNKVINNGEHRSAVELILGYAYSARCEISPATFNSLQELSETFDLKPEYLERVRPLVKH